MSCIYLDPLRLYGFKIVARGGNHSQTHFTLSAKIGEKEGLKPTVSVNTMRVPLFAKIGGKIPP